MTSMDEFVRKLKSIAAQSKLRETATVFEQSYSYVDSNREELLKRYPDHWIAVYKDHVIAADKDLRNLISTLRRSGTRLEEVAVELLTSEETPVLL